MSYIRQRRFSRTMALAIASGIAVSGVMVQSSPITSVVAQAQEQQPNIGGDNSYSFEITEDTTHGYIDIEIPEGAVLDPNSTLPTWAEIEVDTETDEGILRINLDNADVVPGEYNFGVNYTIPGEAEVDETGTVNLSVTINEDFSYTNGDGEDAVFAVAAGDVATLTPSSEVDSLPESASYSFSADSGTVPEWLTLDPDTGVITAAPTADESVINFNGSVSVSWNSEDNPNAQFLAPDNVGTISTDSFSVEISEQDTNPESDFAGSATVTPGDTQLFDAPLNAEGLPFDIVEVLPAETNPEWITINNNGSVTAVVPEDQEAGEYEYSAELGLADSSSITIGGVITVEEATDGDNELGLIFSGDDTAVAGDTVTIAAPTDAEGNALEGATFTGVEGNPSWITVNADGTVTALVPEDITDGVYDYAVDVVIADGSTTTVTGAITVGEQDTESESPFLFNGNTVINPGDDFSISSPTDTEGNALEGATFTAGAENPEWIVVNEDGTVTGQVPEDTVSGDYPYTVDVVTAEGVEDTVRGIITVIDSDDVVTEDQITFAGDIEVEAGDSVDVAAPTYEDGTDLPEGTTVAVTGETPEWITVNDDNTVEIAPDADVELGEYDYSILVTVPGEEPVVLDGVATVVEPTEDDWNAELILSPVDKDDVDGSGDGDDNGNGANGSGDGSADDNDQDDDDVFGPKVKTGGSVKSAGLLDSVKGLFS